MTNGTDPAFIPRSNNGKIFPALTKREYFAAMAMQGQLSSMTNAEVVKALKAADAPEAWCALSACRFADALIAELNKEQKP